MPSKTNLFASVGICIVFSLTGAGLLADEGPSGVVKPSEYLVLRQGGGRGRSAFSSDVVALKLATGSFPTPKDGDVWQGPGDAELKWNSVKANADGGVDARGGYALWVVDSEADKPMILSASGHDMVYVNGESRVGDPYSHGYVHLPIPLVKGKNQLLFRLGRGGVKAQLGPAPGATGARFELSDNTLPDVILGERGKLHAAVVVQNAGSTPCELALLAFSETDGRARTELPVIVPYSVRKVGFTIDPGSPTKEGNLVVGLRLVTRGAGALIDESKISLRVRKPDQTHKRTFISDLDGSVQYYGVNPAPSPDPWKTAEGAAFEKPALFLTLHGAGVEGIGQAEAYSNKTWGHLIAPTNRRPFGFDWEDWGRLDAIEVLEHASKLYGTDPERTYLTGHSMGGHGTWHLGATFPDKFAAIGPSAGWISFYTYAGGRRADGADPIQQMFMRAQTASDTIALLPNYAQLGVYILHGGGDDNVPADQAREMNKRLGEFHHDFQYFEQPNAGHWWDASPEPGADCVDWAPMFDFFARHARPGADRIRKVAFRTSSPRVSNKCYWASIEAQIKPLEMSDIDIQYNPHQRRFFGKTQNVARLALDLGFSETVGLFEVELDGQKLEGLAADSEKTLWLERSGDAWRSIQKPSAELKGPMRYGPFKDVFRNRVVFVAGTRGSAEENRWAIAKARFDAESFWYRGNASIDVVTDREFKPEEAPDRNVVLYGNSETNSAWAGLLANSDVQVDSKGVRFGSKTIEGKDLGALFVKPRPGSDEALVGVVGGSGLAGMKMLDRTPYVSSGVGYPDCVVLGVDALSSGPKGVRAAGFFGLDWKVASGDFVWNEVATSKETNR